MTRVDATRRSMLAMGAAWLAVVLLVGGATFTVVSRATSKVGQAAAMRTVATATSTGSTSPSTRSSSPRPTRRPSHHSTPHPTGEDPTTPVPPPPSGPTAPPTTARPTTSTAPRPRPTPTRSTTPTRQTASFSTQGGTVVASCTGTTLRRESITARDGWRFEDDLEHGRLTVHFWQSEHGDSAAASPSSGLTADSEDVELTIVCSGGKPTRTSH